MSPRMLFVMVMTPDPFGKTPAPKEPLVLLATVTPSSVLRLPTIRPPPLPVALFPEMVLLRMKTVDGTAILLRNAAALIDVVLPETVLWSMVREPSLKMPPPSTSALLPAMVLRVMVRWAPLAAEMPPPKTAVALSEMTLSISVRFARAD